MMGWLPRMCLLLAPNMLLLRMLQMTMVIDMQQRGMMKTQQRTWNTERARISLRC